MRVLKCVKGLGAMLVGVLGLVMLAGWQAGHVSEPFQGASEGASPPAATAPLSVRGSPTISEAAVMRFVRSVTVQILVNIEKYTRPVEWYQEVTRDGQRGEWKARYGEWSREPQRVVVAGTGVIIYSCDGGSWSGTYILTNAHVVELLVRKELLGSPVNPFDEYRLEDLEIETMPPRVTPKKGALPFQQYYFRLPTNFVSIRYSEDQFFTVYAKIVDYDLALDVALLQICQPNGAPAAVWGLPYATLRKDPPRLGENVWVCGAPLGIPFSLDRGRVNQVNLDLGVSGGIVWKKQVKLDVAGAPGSSGSGVFDDQGMLCALLHGTLVYAGNFIRGGILAIPCNLIREWLIWRGWAFIVTAPPHVEAPYYKPTQ